MAPPSDADTVPELEPPVDEEAPAADPPLEPELVALLEAAVLAARVVAPLDVEATAAVDADDAPEPAAVAEPVEPPLPDAPDAPLACVLAAGDLIPKAHAPAAHRWSSGQSASAWQRAPSSFTLQPVALAAKAATAIAMRARLTRRLFIRRLFIRRLFIKRLFIKRLFIKRPPSR